MNITDKSFSETLAFQVQACRRAVIEQPRLTLEDHYSIVNAYIERLRGIHFVVSDFPKAEKRVDDAITELEAFRNQLSGDVGRSPAQSSAALGQGGNQTVIVTKIRTEQ